MAQPTWVTESGSLGTIPEGKFYRIPLEAYDPNFPTDKTKIKFVKISGEFPTGIQLNKNGIIEGTPMSFVQGVPSPVSKNITSKFSIRVYTEKIVNGSVTIDRLRDRTFMLTVTGQDIPKFVTPAGELGSYFDGQLVSIQLEFNDPDPADNITVDIVSGELPRGVTINSSGLIYGYIAPLDEVDGVVSGWENESWDSQPLQFNTGTVSKNYQFTVRITDGVEYNLRTYSIYVGITTADSTAYTVDSSIITADTVTRAPFINNYINDLGEFKHNNFFSYRFDGVDYNNDTLNYSYFGSLPAGLSLDTDTGFLHGTLSDVGLVDQTHNFTIRVYKQDNPLSSNDYDFSIKILGNVNAGVQWNIDSDLGTVNNGEISHLSINATSEIGTTLLYRLKTGSSYNKLPQGLKLTTLGNIIGRVSYQTFRLIDANTTADSKNTSDSSLITVDVNGSSIVTFDNNSTTFDKKFTFTVEAYSADGQISSFKTFNITITDNNSVPMQELSISGLVNHTDRVIVDTLLTNDTIFKEQSIYRPDDPYFGVAKTVNYIHAYGMSPESIETYVTSLNQNHYNKTLTLGNIKTARALDENNNTIYEVIYSEIIDDIENVSDVVSTEVGNVYPNSLDNMRNEVIYKVGQRSNKLPLWMISKQADGKILGFTPSWVIAYTLPGQANTIIYNINKIYGVNLNKVNFEADRYILNAQFTKNWDFEDQKWYVTDATTFDIYNHGTSASVTDITSDTSAITCDLYNATTIETTFDSRSCRFIDTRANTTDITTKTADTTVISADNGTRDTNITFKHTDVYDKYLMFPKRDIINTR